MKLLLYGDGEKEVDKEKCVVSRGRWRRSVGGGCGGGGGGGGGDSSSSSSTSNSSSGRG